MFKIKNNLLPVNNGESVVLDLPEIKDEILIHKDDNGMLHIFSSFCPHFGGPLEVRDKALYCYFHQYKFNIEDGKCENKEISSICRKYSYFKDEDGVALEVIR